MGRLRREGDQPGGHLRWQWTGRGPDLLPSGWHELTPDRGEMVAGSEPPEFFVPNFQCGAVKAAPQAAGKYRKLPIKNLMFPEAMGAREENQSGSIQ